MSVGEQIKLVTMKNYASENSLHHVHGNGNASYIQPLIGRSSRDNQNGFIPNKEYGDWDRYPGSAADRHHHQQQQYNMQLNGHGEKFSRGSSPPSPTHATPISAVPARLKSRPSSGEKSKPKFIPEHEIEIPKDGSLYEYTADDIATFLRHIGIEERIVSHVHKKGLDGVKFSKLKDSDLEALSMKNPIVCHFRDKSIREKSGGKKKLPFML